MPFQIPKRYSIIIINSSNKNTVNVFWQIFYFYNLPITNPPPTTLLPSPGRKRRFCSNSIALHARHAYYRSFSRNWAARSLWHVDYRLFDSLLYNYSVLGSLVTCWVPCDGLTAALTMYSHPVCRHSHKHLTHRPIIAYTQPNYYALAVSALFPILPQIKGTWSTNTTYSPHANVHKVIDKREGPPHEGTNLYTGIPKGGNSFKRTVKNT